MNVEIPDDLKNWPWWCSEDRSYCDATWAPTVAEGNALAAWLEAKGDTPCTISRPQNSNADGYTSYTQVNNHAKVGMFFTHFGDTDRAYQGKFRPKRCPALSPSHVLNFCSQPPFPACNSDTFYVR
jgi:hypothetical protein